MAIVGNTLRRETRLYSRQISHVKPLREAVADSHSNAKNSPSQLTQTGYPDCKASVVNRLPLLHRLLYFPPGVIRLELLALVVKLASFSHAELDLHETTREMHIERDQAHP